MLLSNLDIALRAGTTALLLVLTASLVRDARPSLRTDIDRLGAVAGDLNRNGASIEGMLGSLPGRYDALTRTASYGSWFNFFVCDFDGRVGVPGVGEVNPTTFSASAARCQGSGS